MTQLQGVIDDMTLSQWFLLTMFFVGYECNSEWSTYIRDPTFANMMCPDDQIEFQKVTRNAIECVPTCDRTPGCKSLIYHDDSKMCFGIKSDNPSSTSSLPGAVLYKYTQKSTPMVVGLPDSQFTASSDLGACCVPWYARFNSTEHPWAPGVFDTNQWLQVDFTQQILATYVVTNGHVGDDYSFWVASYKVLTSTDCINYDTIQDGQGSDKVFTGNMDGEDIVQNALEPPVTCRCLKINPVTWNGCCPVLRLEVMGLQI